MSCVYFLSKRTALLFEICLRRSKSVLKTGKRVSGKLAVTDCRTRNLKNKSFYEVSDPLRDLKRIPLIAPDLSYHLPAQPRNRVSVQSQLSSVVK